MNMCVGHRHRICYNICIYIELFLKHYVYKYKGINNFSFYSYIEKWNLVFCFCTKVFFMVVYSIFTID